jgi:hypothetical protein
MKVLITIEETISDIFEIEADSVDEAMESAKQKYKSGEFVLEPGRVTSRMIQGMDENSEEGTEWVVF